MPELEKRIESVLFFKNEPVSAKELAKILDVTVEQIKQGVKNLEVSYRDRGIVLLTLTDKFTLGTSPDLASLIETLEKEEHSPDISKAALECLSIILYRAPVSRREIDLIRGVNSYYTLRRLSIRGLIERGEDDYTYRSTLKLLEHLGISKREDLPEFRSTFSRLEEFTKKEDARGK